MPFKANDLIYEREQPEFLKKLQNESGSKDRARQESSNSRPRKKPVVEDEDGPAYILNRTNESISHSQYQAMLLGERSSATEALDIKHNSDSEAQEIEVKQSAESFDKRPLDAVGTKVEFGNTLKRKIGKVLANDGEQGPLEVDPTVMKSRTVKRKSMKVKLSFNE